MKLTKKLVNSVKILALCTVFTLGLFAPVAMANTSAGVFKHVSIERGGFEVPSDTKNISHQETIRSAVVTLVPENETGTINQIAITGANGEVEFGCSNLRVQNGTDLIKECGGPAVLEPGETTYQARGSGFAPSGNATLIVDLK